jgi:quercetin dioxygenase-like cupin family protein
MTESRREFMTTWHTSTRPPIETWSMREKAGLMETGQSTYRVPPFRPFDLLATPNQALVLLQNQDHRIGVESVCGARETFRRHVDFDTVYFQFAGTTTLETEYGEYVTAPGDVIFIPEGIAHRATGTADSLRWFAFVSTPFVHFMSEANETSHTEFTVTRRGGPAWKIPTGAEQPQKSGRVTERMIRWDDGPNSRTTVERDYASVAGASSTQIKEKVSGIIKLRAFDTFKDVAGTSGEPPPIFRAPYLEMKTYNIIGEQFAFHRALRSEEVRIQFRGAALDMSELENVACVPGLTTVIPRGIAHSVVTDPPDSDQFLRLNFYSNLPWEYPNDLTRHVFDSTFDVATNVIREPDWKLATV